MIFLIISIHLLSIGSFYTNRLFENEVVTSKERIQY